MRLEYRILWIDDQIEDYIENGLKDEFAAYLEKLAFIPDIDCFETVSVAEEKLKNKEYDLILSDYNIGDDGNGKDLIDRIRSGEIYTEILFYSAKPDFEEVAKSLYQDRISFLSLVDDSGFRKFKGKTFRLIDLSIRKLQELNSVRGLVMSQTSDLDTTIEDILIDVMEGENEFTEKLRKYVIKKIEDNAKERSKIIEKINDLSNADIIKHRQLFDADKKSRTLNELLKLCKLLDEELFKKFHENYQSDVLRVRNDLAHAKSDIIDGIEYLIVSRKDGDQPIKYDQAQCIEIRKNLRKYTDLLRKIRERVIELT